MKKRVLIVDDSPSARYALRQVLEGSAAFEVAGEAGSMAQALSQARALRPDLITMDVHLGEQDGLETTRAILEETPTPIVIVTGLDRSGLAFRATEVGALDVLSKPPLGDDARSLRARQRFVSALVALAEVRLIGARRVRSDPVVETSSEVVRPSGILPLVALGASTGGPSTVRSLLARLPRSFPGAIVVVQHIEAGFGPSFAAWLATASGHPTKLVTSVESLEPGVVYVAPDQAHLHYVRGDVVCSISSEPRNFQRPSIDEFFDSIPAWRAARTAAAVLTGMGDDGAAGLLRLRKCGALTLAQSPESCVVGAMPEAALALGAVQSTVSLEAMARDLTRFALQLPLRRDFIQ